MTTISNNLQRVQERLRSACEKAGRESGAVKLLAVSKTYGPDAIRQAFAAGQQAFGENYLQEGVEKIRALADLPLQWHCIGPVQSNKTRLVAEHFDWMHTVDRLKIAQRLSEQRPLERAPLNVCIQVNMDGGPTKAGIPPEAAMELARQVAALPRLKLRGLMTIPEPAPDFEAACVVHRQTQALWAELNRAGLGLDTLSMGMSADLEAAIASGSTMVRVGTAIFGTRTYSDANK